MKVTLSPQAAEQLVSLPKHIQKKAHKQFTFLILDYRHPSLRTRKMSGENHFEARIDLHNRFTYLIEEEDVYILTIGPHDEGLGKK